MQDVQVARLLMKQNSLTGTMIGGIALTQECVDFCALHKIYPECELVDASPAELSRVYEMLDAGNDSGLRYVLDIGKTLNEASFQLPRPRAPKLLGRSRLVAQIALLLNRMALSKIESVVLERSSLIAGFLGATLVAGVGLVALPLLRRMH
mmetsp:Transcript_14380/g.33543  ORF Transcript_14380/g.33543 Transcript_14380/m.33543 type:complete len:151 (+) Transcript_14380:138-590(+)